jgi:homoserine O-acetyltransferase
MLGSRSIHSAASTNPKTGKPYGPDFPDITLRDMVVARRPCSKGPVQHFVAVAGPSFGGYRRVPVGRDVRPS